MRNPDEQIAWLRHENHALRERLGEPVTVFRDNPRQPDMLAALMAAALTGALTTGLVFALIVYLAA